MQQVNVNRIGGVDRCETALLIAKEIARDKSIENIYVANGFKEADAISVALHAGEEIQSIVLTNTNNLNDSVYSRLKEKNIRNAYFIGDETVV